MKRERDVGSGEAVTQDVIKKLSEQQKILSKNFFFFFFSFFFCYPQNARLFFCFYFFYFSVLASFLPCDECPYYCNVSGQASVPCVRCGKSARDHGKLFDAEEIERRMGHFSVIVGKFESQNIKEKDVGAKMIAELLNPVLLDGSLSSEPPFEELCVEDVILNIVRYSQVMFKVRLLDFCVFLYGDVKLFSVDRTVE
jgi:hypothetical protein